MCGIALITGPGAETRETELERMLASLEHRGERTGRYSRPGLCAGVRRLPITDPDGSEQPLTVETEQGPAVILFNGEIFNYKELRESLRSAGREFKTQGDTEVLLRAWLENGRDCLGALRGQFAFVVVSGGEILAARDALGIKPLYYARSRGCLHFASEIKALTFLNQPIHSCEPGRVHVFDGFDGENDVHDAYDWWKPQGRETSADVNWPARLRPALEESVRLRAATDLPLGVVYSGGVDSSVVLHLAHRMHGDVTAFTVGSPGSEDFAISKRFCEERGIRQVLITPGAGELGGAAVREAVEVSELTEYGDIINAAISLPLFRAVREAGVKVVLTGDGSDELFAGYNMYAAEGSGADERLFLYKLMNLHRTELQRVDRCSMAATVEARVPFLDSEVVRIALDMPGEFKRRDGVEKWCLREAFRHELPDYIVNRPKNPLSHSSGLHEIVRGRKYKFKGLYGRAGYELHAPLRADFSHRLRAAAHDLDAALSNGADYSRVYLLLEALKSRLRRFLAR